MAIGGKDMFLRSEGQKLDFSEGVLDTSDIFNTTIAPTVNKLLVDTGAEDPILADISDNAEQAKQQGLQSKSNILKTQEQSESPNFGFEVTTPPVDVPDIPQDDFEQGFEQNFDSNSDDGEATPIDNVQVSGNAHKKRSDIPYKKGGPTAAIRYNNPAAAYPRPSDNKYGLMGYGKLNGGKQGMHKIGRFPTPVHGGAANFDLFAEKYKGMTMYDAVAKWRGNKARGEKVVVPKGYNPKQRIDSKFLKDPNRAVDFFRKMATHESAGKQGLSNKQWKQAWEMWRAGGANEYAKQKKIS